MKFSFLHVADIHFGRAFGSIYSRRENYSNLIELSSSALEDSFKNLVDFAISNKIDMILIAGDTFDSIEHDFNCTKFFIEQLKRLENAGIFLYMICGNHDPLISYKNFFKIYNFQNSKYIKIIGLNTSIYDEFIFSKDNKDLARICALSFENENYYDNPVLKFSCADKNFFNIGLLHCDLSGADNKYAPCLKSDLEKKDYNYWALGHIHKPCETSNIQYCGTIQGRKKDELDCHGARYIEVENNKIIKNELICFDKIQYKKLSIDISDFEDVEDIKNAILDNLEISENKDYILFLELIGINQISDDIEKYIDLIDIPTIYISSVVDKTTLASEIDKENSDFYELFAKKVQNEEYIEKIIKDNFDNTLSQLTKKPMIEFDEINEDLKFYIQKEAKKICGNLF